MTRKAQLEELETFFASIRKTLVAKSDDYAGAEDVLKNFRLAGSVAGSTPDINCLQHIATKVVRLGNLLSTDRTPNHESIDDNLLDLAVYSFLLRCIRKDFSTAHN